MSFDVLGWDFKYHIRINKGLALDKLELTHDTRQKRAHDDIAYQTQASQGTFGKEKETIPDGREVQ